MNWLGFEWRAYAGALAGALLGVVAYVGLRAALAADLPPIVGALAGLACALLARERSPLRGVVVAVLAIWACAATQAYYAAGSSFVGVPAQLIAFHRNVAFMQLALHAVSGALAFLLAGRSFRRGAPLRIAGA